MKVEMQLVKGSLLRFCGVAYVVRNKKVAAMMVKTARPVWSANPRKLYTTVKLSDSALGHEDVNLAGYIDGVPSPCAAICDMASRYLRKMEEACRSQMASRKAGS